MYCNILVTRKMEISQCVGAFISSTGTQVLTYCPPYRTCHSVPGVQCVKYFFILLVVFFFVFLLLLAPATSDHDCAIHDKSYV